MIFVINNLKYDTDKMELISDECVGKYMALLNTLKCVQIS